MPDWDRPHFERQRAGWARSFGPATCGCVALFLWGRAILPAVLLTDGLRAWPLCPICQGSGVDGRVPARPVAVAVPVARVDELLERCGEVAAALRGVA